uniref:C-type lectin domain-containing protein n=1 Tax=Acrobeloides nanus TaxID=290746 RepID=A0A914DYA6_9BILA
MCVMMEGGYWIGGDEITCEIFPGFCFTNTGVCEKAVQVTPVKHISEMRQEKKLRVSQWDPVSILLGVLVGIFISLLFVGLLGFFKSSSIEDSSENFLSSLYYGCYTDTHNRLLSESNYEFRTDNTPIKCIKTCKDGGFTFAGVEYSYECFCGNELKDETTKNPKEKCDSYRCPGSQTEFCGGHWLMTAIVEDMDWDRALQTCVDLDSMIVSIHSKQHNEFLLNLTLQLQPPNITDMYAFWIGLYDTYNVSLWAYGEYLTQFQWLDGSLVDHLSWGMTVLGPLEPDYFIKAFTPLQANRSCTALLSDYHGSIAYWRAITTQWFDDDHSCKSVYSGTICQQDSKIFLLNSTEDNGIGQ